MEVSLDLIQHGVDVADGLGTQLDREQPLADVVDASKSIGVDTHGTCIDDGVGGTRRGEKRQEGILEVVDSAVRDAKGRRAGEGGGDFVLRGEGATEDDELGALFFESKNSRGGKREKKKKRE